MKSAIYVANETPATSLPSGSAIPLGSISRRFGCNLDLNGNQIVAKGQGYYYIESTITFTPSATDTYTLQVYKNGQPVVGALAKVYSSVVNTQTIHAVVRNMCGCCDEPSNLSLVIKADTATNTVTINNVSTFVEKL